MQSITISEKDFLKQIIDLAHIYHWKVAHFRAAQTKHGWRTAVQGDGKGFPDLILARKGRIIVAELKTEKGRLTTEQKEWLDLFSDVLTVDIWRPSDFDYIVQMLR